MAAIGDCLQGVWRELGLTGSISVHVSEPPTDVGTNQDGKRKRVCLVTTLLAVMHSEILVS